MQGRLDVSTEVEGKLDDSSYLEGIPENLRFKRIENTIPLNAILASFEINQLIALITGINRDRIEPAMDCRTQWLDLFVIRTFNQRNCFVFEFNWPKQNNFTRSQ